MKLIIRFEYDEEGNDGWYGSFNTKFQGVPVPASYLNNTRSIRPKSVVTGRKRVYRPGFISPDGDVWYPMLRDIRQWGMLASLKDLIRPILIKRHTVSSPHVTVHCSWDGKNITLPQYEKLAAINERTPRTFLRLEKKYQLHLRLYERGIVIPEWLVNELAKGGNKQFTIKMKYVFHQDIEEQVVFWEPSPDCYTAEDLKALYAIREDFEDVYTNLDKPLPEEFQTQLDMLLGWHNGNWNYMSISAELQNRLTGETVNNSGFRGVEVDHRWRTSECIQECINEAVSEILEPDTHIETVMCYMPGNPWLELNWDNDQRKVVL